MENFVIILIFGYALQLPIGEGISCTGSTRWGSCPVACGVGVQRGRCYNGSLVYRTCINPCSNGASYSSTTGKCLCPKWRAGTCCQVCQHITIAHCVSGYQQCGGSPDGIKCTKCNDPYFSGGYNGGCKACPAIANCKQRYCTTSSNTKCRECYYDRKLYKGTHSDTKCERMCAWDNHYCWPGQCTGGLITGCTCAADFRKVQTSSETSCQPATAPLIVTCDTRLVGQNGNTKMTDEYGGVKDCSHLKDFYGNFQPSFFQFVMSTDYKINAINYPTPSYIIEYKLGVTDTTVYVQKKFVNGSFTTLASHPQLVNSSSENVKTEQRDIGSISVSSEKYSLQYGESLCLEFEAYAGGYLKSKNLLSQTVNAAVQYHKVRSARAICYIYDDVSPRHCREDGSCHVEPLTIERPVTRSPFNKVIFTGWADPIPKDKPTTHASGIERYTVYVNEVLSTKGHLRVDYSTKYMKTLKSTSTDVAIYLKPDKPTLYLVKLEVKDFADNTRQARRFLLYDNISFIETREEKPLIINTASRLSNYTWQTGQTICLSWKDHFINRYYVDDELLSPIQSDQSGLFSGVYEQTTGLLSIYGTPNVYGIIKFLVSVYINGEQYSSKTTSHDLQNQSYCEKFSVKDGDEYTFLIEPVDIAGNTYKENVTVFIDQSEPEIELKNVSNKNNRRESIELPFSNEKIKFEARDPHSGIRNIVWTFGITNSSIEISTGNMSINTKNDFHTCQNGTSNCYCLARGTCVLYNYSIPQSELNVCDDHVKESSKGKFFMSITATNHAFLKHTKYIDVLIDEAGVKELCKTSDNKPLYAGLSSGISVFLLVTLATVVLLVVRRRGCKGGTTKDVGMETYQNLEVISSSVSNDTYGKQARRKVAKRKKLEDYEQLDAKALCGGESYDVVKDWPVAGDTQTMRSAHEDYTVTRREQSHIYEDTETMVAMAKAVDIKPSLPARSPVRQKRSKMKPNARKNSTDEHIYENMVLKPIHN